MEKLNELIKWICGEFNNENQILAEKQNGKIIHPKAKHVNGICNSKIVNLPDNFKGYFVIEESYYDTNGRKSILPHLFLFDINEKNKIRLTSYEIPSDIKKEEFVNSNKDLKLNYNELEVSEKFTPLIYDELNEEYCGVSVSNFLSSTKFTLCEKITNSKIYVNEIFEKNGKRIMGFDEPIIYDKIR